MKRAIPGLPLAIFLLIPFGGHAKTANEVFDSAYPSVVIIQNYDEGGDLRKLGSGVVVPGGAVATNCHVVDGAGQLRVRHNKEDHHAALLHRDGERDVCTLTAVGLKAPAAVLGDTRRPKVGSRVYAIGAPGGLELALSVGVISGLRPGKGGWYLQITAPVSPGSSGGGLFDEEGRLIGLTTFIQVEGQQLNFFALPVEWIVELPKRHRTGPAPYVNWPNRSQVLKQKKDWAGLIDHGLQWTREFPQDAMAWSTLGFAYERSNQDARSIEAYRQALRIQPEYAEAWHNLGFAYGKSGQDDKAIEAYRQALRINPELAGAWHNLGNAYGKSGQVAKSIEAFQQALRVKPNWAKAWYNLGIAYRLSGQKGQVIEVHKRLKTIDPGLADDFFKKNVAPLTGKGRP